MELACELNDNDPWTLLSGAHYSALCGSIEQARSRAERALALSPAPSYLEWAYHSTVRFFCGDYAGAIEACDRAQGINKILPAWRAAALFQLGERAHGAGGDPALRERAAFILGRIVRSDRRSGRRVG